VIHKIKLLCSELNIPNMEKWGIDKDKFQQVVAKMARDALASGSPGNNPRVPSHKEIVELYYTCYEYDFSVSEEMLKS
jgi:alcohol dehydrogenase class IV